MGETWWGSGATKRKVAKKKKKAQKKRSFELAHRHEGEQEIGQQRREGGDKKEGSRPPRGVCADREKEKIEFNWIGPQKRDKNITRDPSEQVSTEEGEVSEQSKIP